MITPQPTYNGFTLETSHLIAHIEKQNQMIKFWKQKYAEEHIENAERVAKQVQSDHVYLEKLISSQNMPHQQLYQDSHSMHHSSEISFDYGSVYHHQNNFSSSLILDGSATSDISCDLSSRSLPFQNPSYLQPSQNFSLYGQVYVPTSMPNDQTLGRDSDRYYF
jgi:hypothetical protein